MLEMSTAEALELFAIYEASLDLQFQVWLTVTFAALVASFGARGNLPRTIVHLMAFLYLSTCIAIAARWGVEVNRVWKLADEFEAVNSFLPPYGVAPMVVVRIATYLLGTLSAIYALYFFQRPGQLK